MNSTSLAGFVRCEHDGVTGGVAENAAFRPGRSVGRVVKPARQHTWPPRLESFGAVARTGLGSDQTG